MCWKFISHLPTLLFITKLLNLHFQFSNIFLFENITISWHIFLSTVLGATLRIPAGSSQKMTQGNDTQFVWPIWLVHRATLRGHPGTFFYMYMGVYFQRKGASIFAHLLFFYYVTFAIFFTFFTASNCPLYSHVFRHLSELP